ncbi:MAG: hypothetical protein QOI83_4909, partial [Streptomycetaceae bacterium]|nr:hypothetical protein [Streptomycetaceae bacterium]
PPPGGDGGVEGFGRAWLSSPSDDDYFSGFWHGVPRVSEYRAPIL